MSKLDMEATLNPIRVRILVLLSQNKEMSAGQIKENLEHVPPATLYRHINALVKANAISIVKENRIRGTVEKIYSLNMNITENPTDEEILDLGFKFIISMLSQLSTYSKGENIDVKKDMLTFQTAPLYMSDEEYIEFMKEIGPVFQKYLNNKPSEERTLRNIYTVMIPNK